jgi:hypothetical protein
MRPPAVGPIENILSGSPRFSRGPPRCHSLGAGVLGLGNKKGALDQCAALKDLDIKLGRRALQKRFRTLPCNSPYFGANERGEGL